MKTFIVFCIQLCCVLLWLEASLAECKEPKRSKLFGGYGLTKFMRTGRDSWDANADVKRRIGKMVSFPRVGRSEPLYTDETSYGAKRPGASSGMWIGPRLGRVQKRNSDEYTPWTYIILNGEGPISRQVHYTPRLGRESEELYDDLMDAEDVVA